MAEELQQPHLHEEKLAAAARLVALQKLRRQEAWDVCVSTHVLASFMTTRDLCALSTCSHLHLPVRRQISKVAVQNFTPSLLSGMAAGNLAEVESLCVEFSFSGFTGSKAYRDAATLAVQRLPKLEYLHLGFQVQSALYCIFGGLRVEGKRGSRLSSLALDWRRSWYLICLLRTGHLSCKGSPLSKASHC